MLDAQTSPGNDVFTALKSGDTFWCGRNPDDHRVRLQVEGRDRDGTLDCTVLAANGGIGRLQQDESDGSIFFVGPRGERGKPVYITRVEDAF